MGNGENVTLIKGSGDLVTGEKLLGEYRRRVGINIKMYSHSCTVYFVELL